MRLIEVVADSSMQAEVGRIQNGLTSGDAGRAGVDDPNINDPWEQSLAPFFNSDNFFTHVEWSAEHGKVMPASPRNSTAKLNPNKRTIKHTITVDRSGKQLKAKWGELKGLLGEAFEKWHSSGQGDKRNGKPPQSISDFDSFIHGHKPVIKYMFLRFKNDPDLMTFASKVIPGGGRETGRRGQKRKAHPHRQPIGGAGAFGASKRQAAEDERMAKLLRAAAPPPDTRLAEALESQAKASQQAADTNLLFGLMDRHEKLVAAKSPLATLFEKKIERVRARARARAERCTTPNIASTPLSSV